MKCIFKIKLIIKKTLLILTFSFYQLLKEEKYPSISSITEGTRQNLIVLNNTEYAVPNHSEKKKRYSPTQSDYKEGMNT